MNPESKDRLLLQDGTIVLRSIRMSDVRQEYVEWLLDPEVTRHSRWREYPHTLESVGDYVRQALDDPNVLLCAILLRESGRHIGNIRLSIAPEHRTAEISLLIGEKDCWGRGCATSAIRLISAHGLGELKLRKIIAGAYGSNLGSIRAFQKAGFHEEGRLKRQFLSPDGEVDHVQLALFPGA
jgi:ribosomal-protein-alanine N-acetyltransferase